MNYLITYEDALRICEAYKNFNFYKTETLINDYKVITFNYFICDYNMFVNPLKDNSGINAFDMRGVTFVFNRDGSLYKRFFMLKKFFNVNQVAETQFNVLKDKKIKSITMKEDGSLIAFMQLPDGTVFAKTQAGFTNEQSKAALKIYEDNVHIKGFVDSVLEQNFTPLFEYVAFDNRIVLKYSGRSLRFIGVRNNNNGDYYSAADFKELPEIESVKTMNFDSLEDIDKLMKIAEDIEGVVVEFEDGQLVKWKTAWYFKMHGIRTMHIFREDFIIEAYLTQKLDDATQELNMTDDADAFKFIDTVKSAVNNWSNYIEENVDELVNEYNSSFYFGNWAKFATDKHKLKFFGLAKIKIEQSENYKKKKIDYMLSKTYRLNDAKNIVEKFKI